MSTLQRLPNVGKVLEQHLLACGITTAEQLREIGAEEVFIRVRMQDPTACLHMLYGIEGAIEGIKDKFLDEATKAKLRTFYQALSAAPTSDEV